MTRGGSRADDPVGRWLRDLRRAADWHRRLLAAGLLAGAFALGLHTLAPAPPTTVPVLAADRDLPAGQLLARADVAVVRRTPDQVPSGALRNFGAATGATLVSGVRRGELLTDARLLGAGAISDLGHGLVATPVRIADAVSVALVRPGDLVDVLAAGSGEGATGGSARLVAASARVLLVPRADGARATASFGEGALVLLATSGQTAARLAGAAVTDRLSIVLLGG